MKIRKLTESEYTLSLVTKIITAVIGIISSAFSTRYLGVLYKGEYNYITHVANIVVLVLNLGIYQSYSYNYKVKGHCILQKYLDICFLQFTILFGVLVCLLITIKDPTTCMIIMLVPFNILKLQYGNIVLIENFQLSMFLSITNSAVLALCYILLFFCTAPSILYMVLLTVIIDILTIVIYTIKLQIVPKIWETDYDFLREVLRFGFIPMLSALLATINYSIDIIFLKKMGIQEELSYYSLAANIVNYVWLLPDAFKTVLFSKSAKKFDKENIEFSSQVSFSFIALCFIGFAVVGKGLLEFVYGNEFINSYSVTLILISGAFSMSIYKLLGVVLVSQGRRIAHFLSLLVSALINIILNYILIPKLGMYGAGIASVCSYTTCGIILLIYFCKLYKEKPSLLLIPTKSTIIRIKNSIKKVHI